MSATTRPPKKDSPEANSVAPGSVVTADNASFDNGESLLGSQVAGDKCEVCGSVLAPDQHYSSVRHPSWQATVRPPTDDGGGSPGRAGQYDQQAPRGLVVEHNSARGLATLLLVSGSGC